MKNFLFWIFSHFGKKETTKQKAFTLVELIVTITILAILWTIAYISLQSFARDARDAARASDLSNMKKVLSLYITTNWTYPKPTDYEEITDDWNTIWYQWTFWDSVRQDLWDKANISETPYDPLTYNQYTYSITSWETEYNIAVVFEQDQTAYITPQLNKLNKTYAAWAYWYTKVDWDYNWKILKYWKCNSLVVYALPSIVKANTGTTNLESIVQNKFLVYNKSKLLPLSYSWTTLFSQEFPTKNIVNSSYIKVFTWTCEQLKDETIQQEFINKLKLAYENTEVEYKIPKIKEIVKEPTLYTAQSIIHNEITPEVKVVAEKESCPWIDWFCANYNWYTYARVNLSYCDTNINNLNSQISNNFWSGWKIAEWNDFSSASVEELWFFFRSLWIDTSLTADIKVWKMTRSGDLTYSWDCSGRIYYMSFHNHSKPSYYAAHDNYHSYYASLWSRYWMWTTLIKK